MFSSAANTVISYIFPFTLGATEPVVKEEEEYPLEEEDEEEEDAFPEPLSSGAFPGPLSPTTFYTGDGPIAPSLEMVDCCDE